MSQSEPGEITFTLKFSAEDMDVLDAAAVLLRKPRDKVIEEYIGELLSKRIKLLVEELDRAMRKFGKR